MSATGPSRPWDRLVLTGIQSCRGIAALLVVFFHAASNLAKDKYFGESAGWLERLFWFGGEAGVAFFFVLSGFIIHYIHARDFDKPATLPTYLRKRASRIYPAYIIVFVGVYVSALLVPSLRESMPTDASVLMRSLLLIPQDKAVVGGTGAPVVIVAWSLQYEVLFYAIFALALIRRWLFCIVAGAVLLGASLALFTAPGGFPLNFLSSHLMVLFGLGVGASMAVKSRIPLLHPGRLLIASTVALGAAVIASTVYRAGHIRAISDLAYGVTSAVMVFALVRYEMQTGRKLAPGVLGTLGDSSYALYLVHFPLIALLSKMAVAVFPKDAFWASVAFLVLVGASVCAGIAFHTWIEAPILRALARKPKST